MSPLSSILLALLAALVVVVAALVAQRGRKTGLHGPPAPWEPPSDLTWDDVRQLIDEADPLTRLTFERSFSVPPEPPRLRVVPLGRGPRRPAQGMPARGSRADLVHSMDWEWDGQYRRVLEDILRRGGRAQGSAPDWSPLSAAPRRARGGCA
jgi:hypothetical protein